MQLTKEEQQVWPRLPQRLSMSHRAALLINDDRVHVEQKGSGILLAHMSNFCRAEQAFASFSHICTLSADLLFVKPGYTSFWRAHDGMAASFVDLRSFAGHPQKAVNDPFLSAAMAEAGLKFQRREVRDQMLDGLCWRRHLFERLKPVVPFSPMRGYNVDGTWPATLLSPLMNTTPCDDLRQLDNYTQQRTSAFVCYPRLVRVDSLISKRRRPEAEQVVEACRQSGPSTCFAIKGFHGRADPARAYVMSTLGSPLIR